MASVVLEDVEVKSKIHNNLVDVVVIPAGLLSLDRNVKYVSKRYKLDL